LKSRPNGFDTSEPLIANPPPTKAPIPAPGNPFGNPAEKLFGGEMP
jgi:hypothetical protein